MRTVQLARALSVVVLAASVVGCTAVYVKPGVTDDQRRRDEVACTRASIERIPGGLMGDVHFSVERVDRACMERRGYSLK